MFERFSTQARAAVVAAAGEARAAGSRQIDCDHLMIGLALGASGEAAAALTAAGLDPARLRELSARQPPADPLDGDALALVGIDLDQVRRAAEAAFGKGALDHAARLPGSRGRLRMTSESRKVLELALRQANRAHDRTLTAGHVLIGIIDQGDNAALRLLDRAGTDSAALRADTERRMTAAA